MMIPNTESATDDELVGNSFRYARANDNREEGIRDELTGAHQAQIARLKADHEEQLRVHKEGRQEMMLK